MSEFVLLVGCGVLTFVSSLVAVVVVMGLKSQWREDIALLSEGLRAFEVRMGHEIRDVSTSVRIEMGQLLNQVREELVRKLDAMVQRIADEAKGDRLENRANFESFRGSLEPLMEKMLQENQRKLEEIRQTVSEKLEGTLDKRLGASFKLVSERLEQVYKGLGEMQNLAVGVGDLKKVMSNVKTRGMWGEIQLGALLDQLLAPEQFERNVQTKKLSNGRVEFAIKLPGQDQSTLPWIWLPIDAKFPIETYQRLVDAQERSDHGACEVESKLLESFIKQSGREISEKYLGPPDTTDFGIMYLPTEGLFAEVVRKPGIIEYLQREHRVIIAGPTTLAALLNSLQMGFKTLAIQKRSSEVWEILGVVKGEFVQFEDILKKVEKKLQEAGNVIESAGRRSRAIQRSLRSVEVAPQEIRQRLAPDVEAP
jgi:DNA recombination protein RmuC